MSERWPFRLYRVRGMGTGTGAGRHPHPRLFRFTHVGATYFVEAGQSISFWCGEGMTIMDLRLYYLGAEWLKRRKPVEIESTAQEPPGIPTTLERRQAVREIAAASAVSRAPGTAGEARHSDMQILEGLYFSSSSRYLAIVEESQVGGGESQETARGTAFLVGSGIPARQVDHATAAPWRWLLIGIGGMLERGELHDW